MSASDPVPDARPPPHKRRVWRVLLVIYAVALTVGTHWPDLELGTEEVPAPDKLIHLIAYAGLAVLLWGSGWVRSSVRFALLLLAWTALDELTQALPGLSRQISWLDLLASQLGVISVVIWRWALGPIGGPANRRRIAAGNLAFARVFRRPASWVMVGAAALGAGAVTGGLAWGFWRLGVPADPGELILIASAAGATVGGHVLVEGLWRRQIAGLVTERPCLRCERSCAALSFAGRGPVACPGCGTEQWRGQWRVRFPMTRGRMLRLTTRPLLTAGALLAALLVLWSLSIGLHTTVPMIGRINRSYHGLESDARLAIDLAALAALAALVARGYRRRLAAIFDRQHQRCVLCRHDLTGTPAPGGEGRCSECGEIYHVPLEESD